MAKKLDPNRYAEYQGRVCDLCGYKVDDPDAYTLAYPDGLTVCCHCDMILLSPAPRLNLRARIREMRGNVPGALDAYRRLFPFPR